jgi:hypothetical protein
MVSMWIGNLANNYSSVSQKFLKRGGDRSHVFHTLPSKPACCCPSPDVGVKRIMQPIWVEERGQNKGSTRWEDRWSWEGGVIGGNP